MPWTHLSYLLGFLQHWSEWVLFERLQQIYGSGPDHYIQSHKQCGRSRTCSVRQCLSSTSWKSTTRLAGLVGKLGQPPIGVRRIASEAVLLLKFKVDDWGCHKRVAPIQSRERKYNVACSIHESDLSWEVGFSAHSEIHPRHTHIIAGYRQNWGRQSWWRSWRGWRYRWWRGGLGRRGRRGGRSNGCRRRGHRSGGR